MKARKSGQSDNSEIAQVLNELADAISKVMGHCLRTVNCSPRTYTLPKHCSDRAESLYL